MTPAHRSFLSPLVVSRPAPFLYLFLFIFRAHVAVMALSFSVHLSPRFAFNVHKSCATHRYIIF